MNELAVIGIALLIFWILKKGKAGEYDTYKRIVGLIPGKEIAPFYTNDTEQSQYILILNNDKYYSLLASINVDPATLQPEQVYNIGPNSYQVIITKPGDSLYGFYQPNLLTSDKIPDMWFMMVKEI